MVGTMTGFLGGEYLPVGLEMNFVEAPLNALLDALAAIVGRTRRRVSEPMPVAEAVAWVLPFEGRWSRELVFSCGAWTAYLNNGMGGGDITARAPAAAKRLDARCVSAMHAPMRPPGHAATQLWIQSPDGVPPLMYRRTLGATAADGWWQWDDWGDPLPFEDTTRYAARRIADRFDRLALLTYLGALEIPIEDESAWGPATVVQYRAWRIRRPVAGAVETARRTYFGE